MATIQPKEGSILCDRQVPGEFRVDDGVIIRRSVGDPDQFGAIFDRHFAIVLRYLQRRVGRVRAEDLACETFAQAFAHRARYESMGATCLPWLYGIATNVMRKDRRTEERRLRAYARAAPGQATDIDIDDLASRLDSVTEGRSVARMLSDLRSVDRDVLLLLALAGLTHEEIAEALGIPPGTVASRVHRLRIKLQQALTCSNPRGNAS